MYSGSSNTTDGKRNGLCRCIGLLLATIFLCEVGLFISAAAYCDAFVAFDKHATLAANASVEGLPPEGARLTGLVISDVHLLGRLRRSWPDRLWTDWQLRKSIFAIGKWFDPELLLVLGDHLDEGDVASDEVVSGCVQVVV